MLVYENDIFLSQGTFFINFDFKNGCKNLYKDDKKNQAADPEKRFLTKSISRPFGLLTAMPTA